MVFIIVMLILSQTRPQVKNLDIAGSILRVKSPCRLFSKQQGLCLTFLTGAYFNNILNFPRYYQLSIPKRFS